MKHLIPLILILLPGCASLSDRGAVTTNTYTLPDGSDIVFWERTKVNIWVPSTQHIKTFVDRTETPVPHYTQQDGAGPGVTEAIIHAAGLGVGLSQSGDTTTQSTSVKGIGAATAGAGALGVGIGISESSARVIGER